MMRLLTRSASLAAALAFGSSAPAQTLAPTNPQAVIAAVSACLEAVQRNGIDEARLARLGWEKASLSRAGEDVEVGLSFYGKRGSDAILMTNAANGPAKPLCIATARLEKAAQYQTVLDQTDALEGVRAVKREKLKIVFMTDSHLVQSELLGSKSEPSVRIAVTAFPGKS